MSSASSSTRYAFVDALRGLAAVWVVTFHAYTKNLVPMTGFELPQPFDAIFSTGYLGVYVFFVISGFVIMQSLRQAHITPRFVGRFALRRSLRLDPPYWATIISMIVLSYISGRTQHDHAALPLPSWQSVVAHIFYVQRFFGFTQIVGVFWTLCYEIQFYLLLVTAVGVWQWQRELLRSRWVIFAPLWIGSALCVAGVLEPTVALSAYGWPFFFLGVVVNWVHNRQERPIMLAIVTAATALLIPFEPEKTAVALVTASAIYLVSVQGRLGTLTLGPVFQYLGRISYSLYLVHMLVGTPLVRFGLRHLGKMNLTHASMLMVLCVGVSIAAAHLMYVFVERPAVRLSHRLIKLEA